jgi:predicted RNase H-like nuclease (RuvC/YqgF family)
MKQIAELKNIIENQKTISTSRLAPFIEAIGKSYAETAAKVANQKGTINTLNRNYSVEKSKAAKLAAHVQHHEDLKRLHHKAKGDLKALREENKELREELRNAKRARN